MPHRQIHLEPAGGLWPPTWPMGLTMLRLLLLPVFLWALLSDAHTPGHSRRWLAVTIFAVMAITDKLDGYLARRFKQTSKLGALLDPVADKLLVGCCVILLSFDWLAPAGFAIPTWVVIAVYGKDVVTAIGVVLVLTIVGHVTVSARPIGKVSTLLQLTMVMGVLLAPDPLAARYHWWHAIVQGLFWGVAAAAIAAMLDYVVLGIRQYLESRSGKEPAGLTTKAPRH